MWSGQEFSRRNLKSLFERTPVRNLDDGDRLVVFSDLHMGNGGHNDDFRANASLFSSVIERYYAERGHTLILNGDIEELQRFRLEDILEQWAGVYRLFERFLSKDRLHRLVGNHDLELIDRSDHGFNVIEALRYRYGEQDLFIFHGHQTMITFERFNRLVGASLRYLANPLRIGNGSVAHSNAKRFRTERRVYEFASGNAIMTLMGHTHRPLFESMAKVDSLKFEIERLCRAYPAASKRERASIEHAIRSHRDELQRVRLDDERATVASLYNSHLLIPCVFNSGTVIGHRGMTCLEIEAGTIALVHWFDAQRSTKYLEYADYEAEQLEQTNYHKVVIKRESLDYIFARIRLLAGP